MSTLTCIRLFADPIQITDCKDKLKTARKSVTTLARILSLTGNEVRLQILFLLDAEKALCPCDLADILSMTIPAISQHLRKLKDGNMVKSRKDKQTVYYSLLPDHVHILKPFFKQLSLSLQKMEIA